MLRVLSFLSTLAVATAANKYYISPPSLLYKYEGLDGTLIYDVLTACGASSPPEPTVIGATQLTSHTCTANADASMFSCVLIVAFSDVGEDVSVRYEEMEDGKMMGISNRVTFFPQVQHELRFDVQVVGSELHSKDWTESQDEDYVNGERKFIFAIVQPASRAGYAVELLPTVKASAIFKEFSDEFKMIRRLHSYSAINDDRTSDDVVSPNAFEVHFEWTAAQDGQVFTFTVEANTFMDRHGVGNNRISQNVSFTSITCEYLKIEPVIRACQNCVTPDSSLDGTMVDDFETYRSERLPTSPVACDASIIGDYNCEVPRLGKKACPKSSYPPSAETGFECAVTGLNLIESCFAVDSNRPAGSCSCSSSCELTQNCCQSYYSLGCCHEGDSTDCTQDKHYLQRGLLTCESADCNPQPFTVPKVYTYGGKDSHYFCYCDAQCVQDNTCCGGTTSRNQVCGL